MRTFSFAKPVLLDLLFLRAGGWEVSAVWQDVCNQVARVEQVFMNSTFFYPKLTILSHTSPLPGESAVGEVITTTIGYWFKFPCVSNGFISLYGFKFGKYRAAGFLQVG